MAPSSQLLVAPAVDILVIVAACSTSPRLTGGAWTLSQYGFLPTGSGVLQRPPTPEYTITFGTDGSVAILADCKNVVGTYAATSLSGSMTISLDVSTLAACPQGSMTDVFLARLAAVHSYGIYNTGTVLTLFHGADGDLVFDLWPDETGTNEGRGGLIVAASQEGRRAATRPPVWPGGLSKAPGQT